MGDTLPPSGGGMPWKECHVMDERLRFVARLLEGEKMAPLCAEFGISRKTGYKIFDRYKDCGVRRFTDRSRRPYRQANRLPAPDRGDDRPPEAGVSGLGRAEDPREAAPAVHRPAPARRSAPSTRCSIATTWCTVAAGGAATRAGTDALTARPSRMRCGAPTTRANSCSAIGGTAIR